MANWIMFYAIGMIDQKLVKGALARWLISVGYSQPMASEMVNGHKKPSLMKAAEIEKKFGIPAASWADGVPLEKTWEQLKLRSE